MFGGSDFSAVTSCSSSSSSIGPTLRRWPPHVFDWDLLMGSSHQKVLALFSWNHLEHCSSLSEPATSYYSQRGDVLLVCFMVGCGPCELPAPPPPHLSSVPSPPTSSPPVHHGCCCLPPEKVKENSGHTRSVAPQPTQVVILLIRDRSLLV